MGADYQSRGVLHKCRDCGEVFNVSVIKWRCLKCSSLADEDKIDEVNIYVYSLDETKRSWLEFELQPKPQFVDLLRRHGYEVTENARVKGRSGAEHSIDILATRDDGLVSHSIAIGIEIAREKVGLDRVLGFDVKAYDSGFHNKVLIVLPELGEEAKKFAQLQRIEILEPKELERVLARGVPRAAGKIEKEPFEFKSKAQLVQYLERQGYTVKKTPKSKAGPVPNITLIYWLPEMKALSLIVLLLMSRWLRIRLDWTRYSSLMTRLMMQVFWTKSLLAFPGSPGKRDSLPSIRERRSLKPGNWSQSHPKREALNPEPKKGNSEPGL